MGGSQLLDGMAEPLTLKSGEDWLERQPSTAEAIIVHDLRVKRDFYLDVESVRAEDLAACIEAFLALQGDRAEWRHKGKAVDVTASILEAAQRFYTKKKLSHAGEAFIDLAVDGESLHVSLTRSITWILRITRRVEGDINVEGAIGVIRKRGLRYETPVGELVRREVIDRFNEALITNTVIFSLYDAQDDFKRLVQRFRDPELPDQLGLPRGKSSASVVNGDKLVVLMQTRFHHIPYWYLLFHKTGDGPPAAALVDYPFDAFQLPICRASYRHIESLALELSRKIHESSATIYTLQRGEIGLVETTRQIHDSQWNLMQSREKLYDLKSTYGLVSQHLTESIENISHYNEVSLTRQGVNAALRSDIRDVETGVGHLINQTEAQLTGVRQTLDEVVRNETLRRLEHSINEEKRMGGVLRSSHRIHSAMFIVELILFAELYEGIMETLPFFDHIRESGETTLIISYHAIAIILGIASSVMLTRFALKTNLSQKLFGIGEKQH